MTLSSKLKKRSRKHKLTHHQDIKNKNKNKNKHNASYSGVSKKYKSQIDKNKTQRLLNNLKTKKNISNDMQLVGGFLGLDYISLKWKMHKFSSIISKLNAFDKSMEKDIETYKIQARSFEERAKEKADLQTQFINNYRAKVIYKIYKTDEKEAPKNKQATHITIDDSIRTADDHLVGINNQITQLDKEIGKDYPEFQRTMKEFKKKAEKFNEITKKYSEQSAFFREIRELKRDYDLAISSKDSKGVSKAYKEKVKKFEANKETYTKILQLTDSELQSRRKIEQEVADLLRTTEYYKDLFGEYKGSQKKSAGKLDKDFGGIKCSGSTELLCQWGEKYRNYADRIFVMDKMCGDIIKKMGDIKKSAEICVKNLNTVFVSYKKDPQPEAMIRFENQMIFLIDMFKKAEKAIALLKAEFYKQTPAARVMIDYNELTVEFNYLRERLKAYKEAFNPEKQPKGELVQKGGRSYSYQRGGSGRGRGRGGTTRQPSPGCDNINQYGLSNKFFYDNKHLDDIIENYKEVEDNIKAHQLKCFETYTKFTKIFNAYFKVWFLTLNLKHNLNDQTNIDNYIKKSLTYVESIKNLLAIRHILNNITTTNEPNKWKWNINLENFIERKFEIAIEPIENIIPPTYKTNKKIKVLYDDGTSIISTPPYTYLKDMLRRIYGNLHPTLPNNTSTQDRDFFGVLEWDANVEDQQDTTIYTGTKNILNNYLDELFKNILFTDTNYYPDNTITTPTIASPATNPPPAPAPNTPDFKKLLDKVDECFQKIDNNASFGWDSEYTEFLDEIKAGLEKQKDYKITTAYQKEIEDIIDDLSRNIDHFQTLNPAEIKHYKREISSYTGYLQSLLNVYEEVIDRGHGDTTALVAVKDARELIESGKAGSIAEDIVLAKPEYIDRLGRPRTGVSASTSAPGSSSAPTPSSASAPGASPTPGVAPDLSVRYILSTEEKSKDKNSPDDLTRQIKDDTNLIQYVLPRVKALDYPVQAQTLEKEFNNIFNALKSLSEPEGSVAIQGLAQKLQELTNLLLELKYIEPKIVGVSVKADTSIRMPMLDWIVKEADKDFDKLQKLSVTKELQELRKQDRLLNKMYEETNVNKDEINKILMKLLSDANDPNKINSSIARDPEMFKILSNTNNLKSLIEVLNNLLPKATSEDNTKKACNILVALGRYLGELDERGEIISKAKTEYKPEDKTQHLPACVFKQDRKKDDRDKDRKGGKGGK